MYKHGDLCIAKDKLQKFLEGLEHDEYDTFDLIERYQGFVARNKGKSGGDSWNASFGKILKMLAADYPLRIQEIQAKVPTQVDGGRTSTSRWKII